MIDIKGRNGYFKYDHKYTLKSTTTDELWIGLYSKRVGDSAPSVINGPVNEVIEFLRGILSEAIRLSSTVDTPYIKLTDEQVKYLERCLLGLEKIPDTTYNLGVSPIVPCIRYVRSLTGCGLKEAKDFIDQLRSELGI